MCVCSHRQINIFKKIFENILVAKIFVINFNEKLAANIVSRMSDLQARIYDSGPMR